MRTQIDRRPYRGRNNKTLANRRQLAESSEGHHRRNWWFSSRHNLCSRTLDFGLTLTRMCLFSIISDTTVERTAVHEKVFTTYYKNRRFKLTDKRKTRNSYTVIK